MGSIPVRVTSKKKQALHKGCLFLFICAPHKTEPTCADTLFAVSGKICVAQGVRIPRASRSRYCGSAEMYEQTDLEMICIDLTCAPHSRTCLPLVVLFILITLSVLLAYYISRQAIFRQWRNAPKVSRTLQASVFLFGDALRARTHSRVQIMQIQSCDLLVLQKKIQARIWVRKIAPPLPCRKPCRAEQIPVRVSPSTFVSQSFGSVHSPSFARNVGHHFDKNNI